ncbi:hypothetical protein V8F33_011345 [Rhypophila sp. PSN 637]
MDPCNTPLEIPALKSAEAFPVERLSAKERNDIFNGVTSAVSTSRPAPLGDYFRNHFVAPHFRLRDIGHFTTDPPKATNANSGNIGRIPVEIMDRIISFADVDSVTKFRQVNRLARRYVEMNLNYKLLVNHAPMPFLGLVKNGLGARHSLFDLAATLQRDLCEVCSTEYGTLVFLGNNIRCCWYCLHYRDCSWLFDVTRNLGVPERVYVPRLPYQENETEPRRSVPVAFLSEHEYRVRCTAAIAHVDPGDKSVLERPSFCLGCPVAAKKLSRTGMIDLLYPHISAHGESMRYDFHHPGMRFSKRIFMEHFKWCSEAQHIREKKKARMEKRVLAEADAETEAEAE